MAIDSGILAKIRKNNYRESALNLSGQKLDDQDVCLLVEALKTNTHITSIDLTKNKITADGALNLIQNSSLTRLKIYNGNDIGIDGLELLYEALVSKNTLTEFPIQGGSGSEIIDKVRRLFKKRKPAKSKSSKTNHQVSRKVVKIEGNDTCSLSVPTQMGIVDGEQEKAWKDVETQLPEAKPEESNGIALQLLQLSESLVMEHAARRVDLFFLLLVAVYNTKLAIEKGDTTEQYGQGSTKLRGTHACHSSLFPAVRMKLKSSDQEHSVDTNPSITLKGTHFAKELNSTVELPAAVNGFDGHLEGRIQPSPLVKACLSILNKVSLGEISPWIGMDEFFINMFKFFGKDPEKYFAKEGKTTSSELKQLVHTYEEKGTFWAAKKGDKEHVRPEYVCKMLGIHDEAKIKLFTEKPELLEEHYLKIQKEIYSSNIGSADGSSQISQELPRAKEANGNTFSVPTSSLSP